MPKRDVVRRKKVEEKLKINYRKHIFGLVVLRKGLRGRGVRREALIGERKS